MKILGKNENFQNNPQKNSNFDAESRILKNQIERIVPYSDLLSLKSFNPIRTPQFLISISILLSFRDYKPKNYILNLDPEI